jgi:hypothetical protein
MKRPVRYFHTYQDILEMAVGDQLHRVLPDGIDDQIGFTVTSCAIAVDAWQDRLATTTRPPRVLDSAHRHHVSCWPQAGVRYDFDFADDSVTKITSKADRGELVAGDCYKLRLMNIQTITESTPISRQRERQNRIVRTRQYETLMQTWILSGREGPEPEKPSHLRHSGHAMAERIRALYSAKLPKSTCDAHAEMLKRKKTRQPKRDRPEDHSPTAK